jgi:hypothetical protein
MSATKPEITMSAISTVTLVSLVCVALGVAMDVTLLMYAATGLGCVSMGFPIMRLAQAVWMRRSIAQAPPQPIVRVLV